MYKVNIIIEFEKIESKLEDIIRSKEKKKPAKKNKEEKLPPLPINMPTF